MSSASIVTCACLRPEVDVQVHQTRSRLVQRTLGCLEERDSADTGEKSAHLDRVEIERSFAQRHQDQSLDLVFSVLCALVRVISQGFVRELDDA
jgi:hypothetical protein